ncbi:MAG: amidohydrolase family protein, partial [Clostridia bacterium]|nr:amidohydrolase family protein [Clostridia bacterium]
MLDLIIQNGTIVDGSGSAPFLGSVGIQNGKIVMNPEGLAARETVDAAGRIVCPGFIDAHSHGDAMIGTESGRHFKTVQGITTEVCGNCGSAYAPVGGSYKEEILKNTAWNYPLDEVSKWDCFSDFLSYVDTKAKMTANARFYVGHNMLRRCAMGYKNANRPATAEELDFMKLLLREAMEAGAAGLSTGLIYVPSCYASTEEVIELAKVIAPFGGIYASHIRNEAERVIEAVQEVLDIGRAAGVETWISHHKVQGKDNWGKQKKTLEMIDRANASGYVTSCDLYPYLRSMNAIRSLVPGWHFSDGTEAFLDRLCDRAYREELRAEMEDPHTPYDNFYR